MQRIKDTPLHRQSELVCFPGTQTRETRFPTEGGFKEIGLFSKTIRIVYEKNIYSCKKYLHCNRKFKSES